MGLWMANIKYKIMKILQLNRGKSIVNNYCTAVALQPRDNLILKRCGFKHFQRCTFFAKFLYIIKQTR